ncbi:MAG: endonuclease VII domain-containing protein [Gammaproteobacteria bacterium]
MDKHCNGCGLDKPEEEFYPKKGRLVRAARCKACFSAYARERNTTEQFTTNLALAVDGQKRCPKCATVKNFSEFYGREDRLEAHCKACCQAYYRTDKGKENSNRHGLKKFGLTVAEYESLLKSQGGVCAICKRLPQLANRRTKRLGVDHEHSSGRIRGLLCDDCNISLGKFKDNVVLLLNAIHYLDSSFEHPLSAVSLSTVNLPINSFITH